MEQEPLQSGKKILKDAGYSLTELGRQQIAELLDTAPESRVTKLRKFSKVVGTVYTASQRLLAIETEREVLQQKLKALDAEEVELCKVLDNKGIENLVSKFVEV
jgi:DNA-binding PadR family transcriptional regulator